MRFFPRLLLCQECCSLLLFSALFAIPKLAISAEKISNSPVPVDSRRWSFQLDDIESPSELVWDKDDHPVKMLMINGIKTYSVQLSGRLGEEGTHLVVANKVVPISSNHEFRFDLPITTSDQSVPVVIVDQAGMTQRDRIVIKYVAKIAPEKKSSKDLSTSAGLSFTYIEYEQSALALSREKAITGKMGITYHPAPSRLSLGASVFFTAFPFGSTLPDHINLSFIGFNARIGFEPFRFSPRWAFKIFAGYYYNAATVLGDSNRADLGYSVSGFQLFATLAFNFVKQNGIDFYLKYAPLGNGFSFSSNNAEIGGGLGYRFIPDEEGRGFILSADFSRLKLNVNSLTVNTSSQSLGLGYHF